VKRQKCGKGKPKLPKCEKTKCEKTNAKKYEVKTGKRKNSKGKKAKIRKCESEHEVRKKSRKIGKKSKDIFANQFRVLEIEPIGCGHVS
jgi:hypothetical protein